MTAQGAVADALSKHPDCTYADWENGLAFPFIPTYVVNLWRNEECYLNNDPPKYVCEGYRKEIAPSLVALSETGSLLTLRPAPGFHEKATGRRRI